jgi:hypothetical protein
MENECAARGDAIQHKIERNFTNYELPILQPWIPSLLKFFLAPHFFA